MNQPTPIGTLYGVGVGPGAPDLLTLRALRILREAAVLVLPRASDFGESQAGRIVEQALGAVAAQERLFLTFPMSKDPARVRPAVEAALDVIGARLATRDPIAFVTEGDPSLYSSFLYVARGARARWPELRIEVVPGVSSVTAVPAVAGIPIADGQERVAIVPATYGVEDLVSVLRGFDTTILMKIGANLPHIVAALEREGLIDRAVFVSRATMPEERVVRDLRTVRREHCDCFSMVVVAKGERRGLLLGEAGIPEGA